MDFGLNLILTFTDRATSGMNRALGSLQSLQTMAVGATRNTSSSLAALSYSADMLGNGFVNTGGKVLSTLTGIVGQINQVGQTVYGAEMGIGKLYARTGASLDELMAVGGKKVREIQEYAAKTMFNFEDMIPIVQMLKANGIEAFDTISSSSGKSSQLLMDYAADLAFFNKQMRNAYGTGIQAAMGALNEYIAEGNKRLLKSGASLDITQILGESTGKTIEERSRQVADLMEKLNLVGMTNTMGGNDPSIMISNLDDALFIFESHLAKSGIRDEFVAILTNLSDAVGVIMKDEPRLIRFANSIGQAFVILMKPIEMVTSGLKDLAKNLMTLMDEHPKIAQFVITGTALAGVLTLITGVGFKLIAILARLGSVFTLAGIQSSSMFGMISGGIGSMLTTVGPLLGLFGGLWVAWHTDLFGAQTLVFDFVSGVIDAWEVAKRATDSSAYEMMYTYNKLDKHSFFGNLTAGLMKAKVFIEALSDAWSDGEMSVGTYQKAVDLGVIDLVSRILDLKYRVEEFVAGFKEGWNEVSTAVADAIRDISGNLDGTIFRTFFDSATEFFTFLTSADLKDWHSFGKDVGEMVPKIVLMGTAFKVLGTALSGLSGLGSIVSSLGSIRLPSLDFSSLALGKGLSDALNKGLVAASQTDIGAKIMNMLLITIPNAIAGMGNSLLVAISQTGIGSAIMNGIAASLSAVAGVSTATLGAIVAGAIASVVAFAFNDPKAFTEKVTQFRDSIIESFSDLWSNISNFFTPIQNGIENLKLSFETFKGSEAFQPLFELLSSIGELIFGTVVPAISGLFDIITTTLGSIVSVVANIFGGLISIISGIFSIITGILSGDLTAMGNGVAQVCTGIVNIILTVLGSAVDIVRSIFSAIVSTGLGLLKGAIGLVQGVFNTVVSIIGNQLNMGLDVVKNVVTSILNFLGFKGAADKVEGVFNKIKSIISGAIETAKSVVSSGVEAIKGAFNFSWKLPDIKLPHFKVSGGKAPFGIGGKGTMPKFDVDWYKEGGVFNQPSIIGVGEAGTEAVMPLENNLGWIDILAGKLLNSMSSLATSIENSSSIRGFVPTTNDGEIRTIGTTQSISNSVDNSRTSNASNVDNRVVFNEGSIVVNLNSSGEEDIRGLAVRIANEIARVQQIKNATNYGVSYAGGV